MSCARQYVSSTTSRVAPESALARFASTTPQKIRSSYFSSSPTSSSSSSAVETRKDALTSSDGVVGYPIDFDIASSVEGKESQVIITLVHLIEE